MNQSELIPHLFRSEFRKIASVLCKWFGIEHIQTAEDIASETFLSALETWTYKGIPENPTGWLYTVAKNKARNYLKRNNLFNQKIRLNINLLPEESIEIDWTDQHFDDSQLQMLFAICHPSIPAESQIGLSLRVLCGFGIDEIANAFLTNKEVINKRLFRAREKLRVGKIAIELPPPTEINNRLETVLTTLYLLFNEGYYSESRDVVLREDLCLEAMRLNYLLIQNPLTNQAPANALFALMCFHASRFPARKNDRGEMILYQDQDEMLWNQELITKGAFYLSQASGGEQISRYHVEASIAYWHTVKADTPEKWEAILQLYNRLLQIQYSPVAALNRTFALSKARGKWLAIREAEKLNLHANHYYHLLLGELYTGIDNSKALEHFKKALLMAKTQSDQHSIERKISMLKINSGEI